MNICTKGSEKVTKAKREKQLQMRCMGLCLGLLVVGFIPAMKEEPVPEVAEQTETETEIIQWKQDTEEVSIEPLTEIIVAEPAEPELISLGEFFLTAYCACTHCSDHWGKQTATGTVTIEGRTVAVDPEVIPYGTILIINGHEYVAEDCGGSVKGKHIDIYHEDHMEAKVFGEQYAEVFTYGK